MAGGLAAWGITTVALESTGVYWIPPFEHWETKGFEVLRVEPQPVQKSKGRPKRDGHACQWLQRRHPLGLLAGAFRPPDQVGVRRSYVRPRAMLLADARQHLQHRQTALTQMKIKRQHGVSDVTGETGMAIIRAMLAGERDPVRLARLRHYRGHHDEETIAKALHGQWRDEHLCALAQAVALYDMDHETIAECARQIAAQLGTFADCQDRAAWPPASRPRKRTRTRPHFDGRGSLPRITGGDLTAIEGIDGPTALTIIGESGRDRGRWPTVTHFTSRLGLCPHPRVSGGKV